MEEATVLRLADQILQDPLRSRIKSLFTEVHTPCFVPLIGDTHVCAGDVLHAGDHWIELEMLWFTPGLGFTGYPKGEHVMKIHLQDALQRSIRLAAGVQIICAGNLTKQRKTRRFGLILQQYPSAQNSFERWSGHHFIFMQVLFPDGAKRCTGSMTPRTSSSKVQKFRLILTAWSCKYGH